MYRVHSLHVAQWKGPSLRKTGLGLGACVVDCIDYVVVQSCRLEQSDNVWFD